MENAYGLVVGIANYQNINKLPKSVLADAEAIREVLIDPNRCAYPSENVEILLDGEATRTGLLNSLTKLAQHCNEESTVFFYLSGHGGRIKSGQFTGEYVLPVDVLYESAESLASTAISGSQFTEMLRSVPARKVVVVLDTCFSGGIGEPKTVDVSGFGPIPEHFYETLATGRGRVIISSSLSSEVSYVFPGATNSLFTQHMLLGLQGAAPCSGGVIRIFDLYHYVQPRVTKDCPRQHPFFKAAVEESFPIALYLGGKALDTAVYQSVVNPIAASSGKPERIMRQLDLLLGIEQKLPEHERSVLSAALSLVTKNGAEPESADLQQTAHPTVADEIKEVVERSHNESAAVARPFKYPKTELLSAILRIGLRLDLRRSGMSSSVLSDESSWKLDNWLSYLTEEIVCERGLLHFNLIAPGECWVAPLSSATALAVESLWQQLRSVLTRHNMSFAVSRPRFEIDEKLGSVPPGVLEQISAAAQEALRAWPKFPHLGSKELPDIERLLPLPESAISSPVVFRGRNGSATRLSFNGATVMVVGIKGKEHRIEYWPPTEETTECVLECNEGAGFVPLIYARVRRLYELESELFCSSEDRIDGCRRLGLKNDLLRTLWPRIADGKAESSELAEVLHLLRDAWESYGKLLGTFDSLDCRRDVYWDAMELIRKRMTKEEKI